MGDIEDDGGFPGAKVMVHLRDYDPANAVVGPRMRTEDQVHNCTRCHLSTKRSRPVCAEWPGNSRLGRGAFAVLGESASADDLPRGRPFMGKASKLLRAVLREAGTEHDVDCDRLAAWVNTVSCMPFDEDPITHKRALRSPNDDEMRSCRSPMFAQLEAADVKHVLLVGAKALSAFRRDLTVDYARGGWFVWRDRWLVYVIDHPLAVMRNPAMRGQWVQSVHDFVSDIASDEAVERMSANPCAECGKGKNKLVNKNVVVLDENAVGYCHKHADLARKAKNKSDAMWRKEADGQYDLLEGIDPFVLNGVR